MRQGTACLRACPCGRTLQLWCGGCRTHLSAPLAAPWLRPAERYPHVVCRGGGRLFVGAVAAPVRSGAGFHVPQGAGIARRARPPPRVANPRTSHLAAPRAAVDAGRGRSGLTTNAKATGTKPTLPNWRVSCRKTVPGTRGRRFGWANPGQFVPEFEEAMNALSPGQISAPLVSRFGVHLIHVVERRCHLKRARAARNRVTWCASASSTVSQNLGTRNARPRLYRAARVVRGLAITLFYKMRCATKCLALGAQHSRGRPPGKLGNNAQRHFDHNR